MIRQPTVFVLGAGAGAPYGFPTGKKLRADICNEFPILVYQLVKKEHGNVEALQIKRKAIEFTEAFFKSTTPSIDLFLARNDKFADIGKLAIVLHILRAEAVSRFREKALYPEEDWYSHLFERMTSELTRSEDYVSFSKNKVAFITFNYDRSLEHFLYESLSNSFSSIAQDEIISQLERIKIFHVYGRVDDLPWREGQIYGSAYDLRVLRKVQENIRIIYETEGAADDGLMGAQGIISKAKRVFFLGFGYAKENLDIVGIPDVFKLGQKIYGTAHGLFDLEVVRVQDKLRENPELVTPEGYDRTPIIIEQLKCLDLLRNYL